MFPLSYFDWAEIAALLTGLFCLYSLKGSAFRPLVGLLGLVVAAELLGRYIVKVLHRQNNVWVFNISTNIEFVIYALIFYRCLTFPAFKRIAWWFLCLYPLVAFINVVFIQGFFYFHSMTMSLGSLFMILFCCLSFYEILYLREKMNLLQMPLFWFSTGILFFYTGDLLYNLFFSYLVSNRFNYKLLFRSINNNLIILLYFCFIVTFLCLKKNNRSLPES